MQCHSMMYDKYLHWNQTLARYLSTKSHNTLCETTTNLGAIVSIPRVDYIQDSGKQLQHNEEQSLSYKFTIHCSI